MLDQEAAGINVFRFSFYEGFVGFFLVLLRVRAAHARAIAIAVMLPGLDSAKKAAADLV